MAKRGKKTETAETVEDNQPGTGRIEAFSDGVIAIVLTIMVLELRLPHDIAEHGFAAVFAPLAPKLISYAMSFLVVAIMWVNHHQLIPTAPIATRPLMWWNNLLLFWMSLIPFVTGFVGEHPFMPLAVASYGFVLAGSAASFVLLRLYIAQVTKTERKMIAHHARVLRKSLIGAGLYALAVPFAFVSVYISMAIFALIPAMFFLPEPLPDALPDELE